MKKIFNQEETYKDLIKAYASKIKATHKLIQKENEYLKQGTFNKVSENLPQKQRSLNDLMIFETKIAKIKLKQPEDKISYEKIAETISSLYEGFKQTIQENEILLKANLKFAHKIIEANKSLQQEKIRDTKCYDKYGKRELNYNKNNLFTTNLANKV